MVASDAGLRRVAVHAGTAVVDLALPTGVPVAVLVPSIIDALDGADGFEPGSARRYQLSRPGASTLDSATTLADNDIRDGAVLVLSSPPTPPAVRRYDDAAQAVSATVAAAARPWGRRQSRLTGAVAALFLAGIGVASLVRNALAHNDIQAAAVSASVALIAGLSAVIAHRAYGDGIAGLALSLLATCFAAVAGVLAVPGAPGVPAVLLASSAAAATSVLAMRASGCGAVTLTATSCGSALVAVAALGALITAAPQRSVGSVSALVSLGLLGASARVSIVLAGLAPQLPPEPDIGDVGREPSGLGAKAARADRWLTSLLAAFAASAAVGAIVTVLAGAARPSCIAFGALTGALLLLRSRGGDLRRALVFVVAGMAVIATTFGAAAAQAPERGPWIAAGTAILVAAAMCLGFVAPAVALSPVARRGAELLESLALAATVPLTCWICGLYGVVRGLSLS